MPIFGKSKGLAETARAAADQLSGGPADIKRQLAAGDLPANLRENRQLAVIERYHIKWLLDKGSRNEK